LVHRVRETALGAYAHQDVPFEKLLDVLQLERALDHTPLFNVMFVLQNAPTGDVRATSSLTMRPLEAETGNAKFDLTLAMSESRSGIAGSFEYSTDLFEAQTIERLIGEFQILIEGIAADPERRISEYQLLSSADREKILVAWNDTAANLSDGRVVPALFEAQA